MALSHNVNSSVGISTQEVYKLNFTWIIENFRHIPFDHLGDTIISPVYEDPAIHQSKWHLEMSRLNSDEIGALSLYARLLSCNEESLTVKCTFSIVDDKRCSLFKQSHSEGIRNVEPDTKVGWWNFMPYNEFINNCCRYLTGKQLRMVCNIYIIGDMTRSSVIAAQEFQEVPPSSFHKDMETLMMNENAYDMTLCMDGKEFRCHKAILAGRSVVFAKLFGQLKSQEVLPQDRLDMAPISMEENVFRQMLRFIYTDSVKDLKTLAVPLLCAAHQFCLERLKAICENHLAKELTVENCVSAFICADRYSSHGLKQEARRFICANMKDLVNKDCWNRLAETDTDLMNDVLMCALENIHISDVASGL